LNKTLILTRENRKMFLAVLKKSFSSDCSKMLRCKASEALFSPAGQAGNAESGVTTNKE